LPAKPKRTNEEIAKKFLKYSFHDINYTYKDLADGEKALCSKSEFERLIAWIQER
jgi:hypothetical protein